MELVGRAGVVRRYRWLSFAIAALCVVPSSARADFAGDKAKEIYNNRGFNAYRETVSELPFEHIDPMSGNLLLTFTDLVLPGNAGFDLRIQRTYNSKIYSDKPNQPYIEDSWAGIGWSLHFGRVLDPDSAAPGPVVEMPDGSRHQLYLHKTNETSRFRSKDFWTFDRYPSGGGAPILRLPSGITYTFGHRGVVAGIANQPLFVTKIEDPFNNQIIVNYLLVDPDDPSRPVPGDVIDTVEQVFATGERRVVRFGYDAVLPDASGRPTASCSLRSMSLVGSSWTWNYVQKPTASSFIHTLLTSVEPPEGPSWKFLYDEGSASTLPNEITDLTTPNGG